MEKQKETDSALQSNEKNDATKQKNEREAGKRRKRLAWGCGVSLLLGPVLLYLLFLRFWFLIVPWPLISFVDLFVVPFHSNLVNSLPIFGEEELRAEAAAYLKTKYGMEFEVGPMQRKWEGDYDFRFFYKRVKAWATLKEDPTVEIGLVGNINGGGWDDGNWFYERLWEQEMRHRVAKLLGNENVEVNLRESNLERRAYEHLVPDGTPISFDRGRALLGLKGGDYIIEVDQYIFVDSTDIETKTAPHSKDWVMQKTLGLENTLSCDAKLMCHAVHAISSQAKDEFPTVLATHLQKPLSTRNKIYPPVWAEKRGYNFFFLGVSKWRGKEWDFF